MSDVDNQRSRGRLSGHVYETLKSRLLDGHYPAGSRVSVETVRAEFGVSKQPVMEALRQLAADGIVEILPQIGCVVKSYSPRDVVDFFEVFAAFEGAMAGAAAKRGTPEDVQRLESIIAAATARDHQPGADESSAYRRENRDFHSAIHRAVASPIMSESSRRLWDLSDFLINTAGRPLPLGYVTEERHSEHAEIVAAIRAGDSEEARRVMEAHIRSTPALILGDVLADQGAAR
ncbi:GntR family transcriptional regulator [Salinibacterium sp. dk2585]|uniref:GntR family transcriptional regulator n=1 Tax=unclassified Salinibacterium TaxID=2632331 RepID=UPI0011C24B31|nr:MULTISPECIES: GntR family transcriptional regulator [unclassified Salinibacterium]QEE60407.1 GntR family transcriptional regulator [Salinibacterium sp. dk2585]TXK55480.1 GntR family transcriptional regulator [Salinibacterium sp. dk5596]